MKSLRTRSFAAAFVSVTMTVGVIGGAAGPALAAYNPANPPYPADSLNVASVAIYNAAGAVVTSGSSATGLDQYYFVASSSFSGARTKAILFGYLAEAGKDPEAFSGQGLGASTTYPATSAPSPVNTFTAPVAKGDPLQSFQALANTYRNLAPSSSDFHQLYQLRVKTTFPTPTSQTYAYADIKIDTTAGTWTQVGPAPAAAVAPNAPTIGMATPGDGQATVRFTPPTNNGGSAVTGYTVTSSPGGVVQSGSGSPISVIGLSNGTPYTFIVTATNTAGTSAPSGPSNSVRPAAPSVPGAPTSVSATPGNTTAVVSFAAPASDGGSSITSYTVTATDGSTAVTKTVTGISTKLTGLTNGVAYQITVVATNARGDGPASSPAVTVTPATTVPGAPTGVTAIARDGGATVSFTGPSDGGSAIISYTVRASTGQEATTAATPATFTGLSNGTSRTFTVVATNAKGPGPRSAASSPVVFHTTALTAVITSAVNAGSKVALSGKLSGRSVTANRVVATIFTSGHGTRTLSLTTSSTGTYATTFAVSYNTSVVVRFAGSTNQRAATSPLVRTSVRTLVKITSPTSGTRIKVRTIRVTGTTSPNKAGQTVSLYERRGTTYVKLASARVASNGTYSFTRTFTKATHVLQVRIAAVTNNAAGASTTITLFEV